MAFVSAIAAARLPSVVAMRSRNFHAKPMNASPCWCTPDPLGYWRVFVPVRMKPPLVKKFSPMVGKSSRYIEQMSPKDSLRPFVC